MGEEREHTHKEYKDQLEFSDTQIDNGAGEDDFLISVGLLMKDNEEYHGLLKEENFGIKEKTEDETKISSADNIFTIKHYIRDNLKRITKSRALQVDLKKRIVNLKKIREHQEGSDTETATLITIERMIDDMLSKDIEE
ncbi:hypothetical protein LCGC14_1479450 [marine sediment metagenome]|uniref:Uncharacterized protein n=1 Tax=marine sediment metagenome TaxID=412755 RepID=A0A0F9J9Y1_9ZZZZ